jgi:predicted ribosomally synthesized peptide with SipW-like signal peptide
MVNGRQVKLNGPQTERLNTALRSAFPEQESLEIMLLHKLDTRLDDIGLGSNYPSTVQKVIEHFNAKWQVKDLVKMARKENPTNIELCKFQEEILIPLLKQSHKIIKNGHVKAAFPYWLYVAGAALLLIAIGVFAYFTDFSNSPLAVSCSDDWPVHSVGQNSTGHNIYAIQYLLRHKGLTIEISGGYTSTTQSAVTDFQRQSGLPSDGIIDSATWDKLLIVVQKDRARRDSVRAVQHLLNFKFEQDYVAVDGIFGDVTEGAIIDFQEANKLNTNGVVGKRTWFYLLCSS